MVPGNMVITVSASYAGLHTMTITAIKSLHTCRAMSVKVSGGFFLD